LLDDDVPPSPGPIRGPQTNGSGRFILHRFREQLDSVAKIFYPHNQNARQPANIDGFPPTALLNMWYGCAALLQWGVSQTIDTIRSSVGSQYYDIANSEGERSPGDDDFNGGDNSDKEPLTPPKSKEIAQPSRAQGKGGRTQSGSRLNTMNEAMDFLTLL